MIEYKNVVGVLVFNERRELALQLRAAGDESFPLHWDFSAGGGVDDGEDVGKCAERELKEELGIQSEPELIAEDHFSYLAWNPDVIRKVDLALYKVVHNGPFSLNPTEVEKVEFLSLEVVKKMIESGQKFHPEFIHMWNKGLVSSEGGLY
jgi:isopentenyldiphosphate isomerase